ncbi:lipid A 3-O-deacylase PagL [Sphingobacterium yanglingense]|uniref:Lipid A 3-O-deacylase PagL n=2 Tax=Sphingobacterium yanglingense TaxID=1437280 RepID=A0A4R6WRY6_9SPHI|nr:lipid A 3-O-deacylase PagL [Sphingobacterium yanglingense]
MDINFVTESKIQKRIGFTFFYYFTIIFNYSIVSKLLMNNRICFLLFFVAFSLSNAFGQNLLTKIDSTSREKVGYSHHIAVEFRPASVLASSPFYKEHNGQEQRIRSAFSGHLKYSFGLPTGSLGKEVFRNTEQGIGIAYFSFRRGQEFGSPVATYFFQNAEIANLGKGLSLGYEWNFGLSTGWKPYNPQTNPENLIVGSRENAYINLGMFLKWRLMDRLSVTGGADITHFSNGNTEYPNAGVNMLGGKIGLQYDVSKLVTVDVKATNTLQAHAFPKHISYDLVVFGSWRRKGVYSFGSQVASPHKYPVVGAYFAPMYNVSYRFRTGLSLDGIYDGSANVYTEDYIVGTQQQFFKPNWNQQVALGISARAEYIMPIFTIGIGLGKNVLYKGADFNGTYQSFALKIGTSRSSFLHIGYNLKDFHEPNYLMLGLGYRFHNKTPSFLGH